MSTDSGIPDYRGPDSPPSNPMTIRQFTSDPEFRQRYWARNHVGWRHMDETLPNAGHRALAALESAGVVSGLITQNVDLLHSKAGSRSVVNLHGTYAQVICLDCGATMGRDELAGALGLTLMLDKMDKVTTAVFSGELPSAIEFLEPGKTFEENVDSLRDFIIAQLHALVLLRLIGDD